MGWSFEFSERPQMPALAWVARVRRGRVHVDHGRSVRHEDGAFFEGTWFGPPGLQSVHASTAVFGSGMLIRGAELLIVTPSHHLEGVYHAQRDGALVVSNSLVGLVSATSLEFDPEFDYPSMFTQASRLCWLIEEPTADGLRLAGSRLDIPTRSVPISVQFYEMLSVAADLSVTEVRRPREPAFESFADYRARLSAVAASVLASAPDYAPVVALSAGYDSPAVAVIAAQAGCTTALGFATARPTAHDDGRDDSGAHIAATLGLHMVNEDRLAYRRRDDMVEAEFLSAGMAAEDVVFAGLEPYLAKRTLFTGYWAGPDWAMAERDQWREVRPTTTAGADIGEFRLRVDFVHVPLPVFAAARSLDGPSLLDRPEMAPFKVGGHYDRPIPRRILEEAGIARGSFGRVKRAPSVLPARDGIESLTPASRAAVERFAAAEGFVLPRRARRPFSRLERGLAKGARRLRLGPLARRLDRRRANLTHFEPRLGNLLLRWAVGVVGSRYAELLDDGQRAAVGGPTRAVGGE